jgi:dTDP-glucose 4,6-dehydratase
MTRSLIAGAAGFIGSHLCRRLLDDGHHVVGVDNFITGSKSNILPLLEHPHFEFHHADVIQPLQVPGALDEVYHLASLASPVAYYQHPLQTLYSGSDATRHLLELCRDSGARFLLTSTSEVYGDPDIHPQVETYWGNVNPIGPRSVYDESKRYAEALTMAYQRLDLVEVRIARLFNTYGPRMARDDGRVIPAFACQCIEGEPLTVFGDGSQTRSFCFISDTVDGIVRLMRSDYAKPCNIGNPQEMTVADLATFMVKNTGSRSAISYHPLPTDDPKRRCPDISLAKAQLGWEPVVSLEDGLGQTLDYFRTICLPKDNVAP